MPDAAALVLHTSGTTARPKLVPLTHGQLTLSAHNIARTLALTPRDRCLNVMPLYHIHALVGTLLASLSAGASVICAPRFHAPSFHGWLNDLEPTWYSAVPTMHQAILERSDRPVASTLRFIRSSSAPLTPHVQEALEETFGVPAIQAYGMTEAAHQMTSNPLPPAVRKPGSVGVASHIEVAAIDDQGRQLDAGDVGEIAIRGDTVFSGYEANPEANAQAFVNGWFRTGDEGLLDDDGYLFLRGRTKEIINRGGEKVSPAEVEDALLRHRAVAQAVSFAVPDARLGESVGAAVVLRAGAEATERELQEHVAGRLADFKVPSVVAFVNELPTGTTGKLQRIGLAGQLGIAEGGRPAARAEYVAPRTAAEEDMARLWAGALGVDDVGAEDDFFSLGGDSILGAEVVARIAERDGRVLPLTTFMWAPTLSSFTALVESGAWDEGSSIVPVQVEGARPPLFVTHGLQDEVFNVGTLKRTLGEDQPLYAVRAVPGIDGYASVEALAGSYFRQIQRIQPQGPYLFASICSGSAIVFELVRCARRSGQGVALAAVVDPRAEFGQPFLRHYAERTIEHARNRTVLWAVSRKLRHWRSRLLPAKYPHTDTSDPLRLALTSVGRRYRLEGRLPAKLTVISTMDYKTSPSTWDELADEVE